MAAYRRALFSGTPDAALPLPMGNTGTNLLNAPGEPAVRTYAPYAPADNRPNDKPNDVVDLNSSSSLADMGAIEGQILTAVNQEILYADFDVVGKPFNSEAGNFTENYTSQFADASFTFKGEDGPNGKKQYHFQESKIKLSAAGIDAILGQAIKSSGGSVVTFSEFCQFLQNTIAAGTTPGPGVEFALALLKNVEFLKKEWKFSYDKDGNINKMTVGGEPVDPNSPLWAIGTRLENSMSNSLAQNGLIDGYAPHGTGGVTPYGTPTDMASNKPATNPKPGHHKPLAPA